MTRSTCYEEAAERKERATLAIREVDRRIALPLEEKVDYSRALVRDVIELYEDALYVACSFGKDSVAVLSLAREVNPDVLVIFSDPGIEHKETYAFRDELVESWDLNYVEAKPERKFWNLVKEFGVPKIRYGNSEPACCYHLKLAPARRVVYDRELLASMTGLTADESFVRRWTFARHGDTYETSKAYRYPIAKIHPIGYWTEADVWQFTNENELPVNPAYERLKVDRIGCKFCTAWTGWERQMKRLYPRVYRYLKKLIAEERRVELGVSRLDDFVAETI